ncbi:MAG: hypothetical protein R3F43_29215 [bacterium]
MDTEPLRTALRRFDPRRLRPELPRPLQVRWDGLRRDVAAFASAFTDQRRPGRAAGRPRLHGAHRRRPGPRSADAGHRRRRPPHARRRAAAARPARRGPVPFSPGSS